jgi:multiple antibiotic resistance protein
MLDWESVHTATVFDLFLLLLIGLGPKIVLLPFVELTAALPEATKRRVVLKMLQGAAGVALILLVLGGVLTKVLHFSPGALSIASGIILLIMSVPMVLGSGGSELDTSRLEDADPMELAVFPLTIPYLVTPVGIVVLVTLSAESHSVTVYAVVVGLLALVLLLDVLVLLGASRVSKHLHKNRMQLLEHLFGFLLAALAVELALSGLDSLGLIHLDLH